MRPLTALAVALCLAGCSQRDTPSRATATAASTPGATVERAPVTYLDVPKPFRVKSETDPAEAMECESGQCYWQQKQSVSVVDRPNGGVVIKLVVRGGNSTYSPGNMPVRWSPDIKIAWRDLTSYLFCSLKHPAMIGKVGNTYHVERLQLYEPPKPQRATAEVYMEECHGLTSDAWNAEVLKQLGYAQVRSATMIYPTLKDGLKAMVR